MVFANAKLTFGFDYFNAGAAPVLPYGLTLPTSGSFDGIVYTPFYPVSYFVNNDYFVSFTSQAQFNKATATNASANIQYLNTAEIVGISAYDSNGQFVPTATITSQGLQATTGGNFTIVQSPEPGGFLLAGVGITAVWRSRRRLL